MFRRFMTTYEDEPSAAPKVRSCVCITLASTCRNSMHDASPQMHLSLLVAAGKCE